VSLEFIVGIGECKSCVGIKREAVPSNTLLVRQIRRELDVLIESGLADG
jgi:hypothetical protein